MKTCRRCVLRVAMIQASKHGVPTCRDHRCLVSLGRLTSSRCRSPACKRSPQIADDLNLEKDVSDTPLPYTDRLV
uniref:Uncharacterized protein n=1 Tax=Sphaerodactylus townsendi TaxID=933632 RepID=A0ACB8EGM1_9SAUR